MRALPARCAPLAAQGAPCGPRPGARRARCAPRAAAARAEGGAVASATASQDCVGAAPELLEGYDATLAALCAEVDACGAGDAVTLRSYVLEGGISSRRLLRSLRGAARRGAALSLGCDCSPLSALTRAWEGTDTLADELTALAAEFPRSVSVSASRAPDHSKYLIVRRGDEDASAAVFGGINIGDRFQSWRDYAVRLRGRDATAALAAALQPAAGSAQQAAAGAIVSYATNAPASFCPLAFALRAPLPGVFGVAAALRGFFDDASLRTYTVAAAYVDAAGAALLERALARGASITLVMPRTPNVYPHANAAALCRLMLGAGAGATRGRGQLTARMHPAMVHAKAAVGLRADGTAVALIGSANLKERSLTQFGELLMRADGGAFTARLAAALQQLAAESEEVCCAAPPREDARDVAALLARAAAALGAPPPVLSPALRYVPAIAALEEWMG